MVTRRPKLKIANLLYFFHFTNVDERVTAIVTIPYKLFISRAYVLHSWNLFSINAEGPGESCRLQYLLRQLIYLKQKVDPNTFQPLAVVDSQLFLNLPYDTLREDFLYECNNGKRSLRYFEPSRRSSSVCSPRRIRCEIRRRQILLWSSKSKYGEIARWIKIDWCSKIS